MFQKNEVIFSDGIGVCKVTEIANLSVNKSIPVQYYRLRSVVDKEKVSYIPVGEHKVVLRELLSLDEAEAKLCMENLTPLEKQEIEYVLGLERMEKKNEEN